MSIKVITQSTSERLQETKELFEKIKPFLDDGEIYTNACMKVKNLKRRPRIREGGWFRDVIEYGETQGYKYEDYSYRRKTK